MSNQFDDGELAILTDALRQWSVDGSRTHQEVMDALELLTKVNRMVCQHQNQSYLGQGYWRCADCGYEPPPVNAGAFRIRNPDGSDGGPYP